MKYCSKCGQPLDDAALTCSACSARCEATVNRTISVRKTDTTMLVWAIINIVFCSRLFGIIALVFTLMAQNAATDDEEASKLHTAKIFNIVATSLLVGSILIGIIVMIFTVVFPIAFLAPLAVLIGNAQ